MFLEWGLGGFGCGFGVEEGLRHLGAGLWEGGLISKRGDKGCRTGFLVGLGCP